MNPRYRRMLIPGLLVTLLVIVVVVSLVRAARGSASEGDGPPGVVSTITDARLTESSALSVSTRDRDLAYTINDSGHSPTVYVVKVSTGEVVGRTTILDNAFDDPESLAVDGKGNLWIADAGDNLGNRNDVALYAIPEPGPGDHSVKARRYPLRYRDRPHDVEALVINPKSGRKFLIAKGLFSGTALAVPRRLSENTTNWIESGGPSVPGMITGGSAVPDGERYLLRSYADLYTFDAQSWEPIGEAVELPQQQQGESIAAETGGRTALIGSEGSNSTLLRVSLPAQALSALKESNRAETSPTTADEDGPDLVVWLAGFMVTSMAATGIIGFLLMWRAHRRHTAE